MKNYVGFVESFLATKGNMTTKDFLDNGYSMDEFIRYSNANLNFENMLNVLLNGYSQNETQISVRLKKMLVEYKGGSKNE